MQQRRLQGCTYHFSYNLALKCIQNFRSYETLQDTNPSLRSLFENLGPLKDEQKEMSIFEIHKESMVNRKP